MRLLTFEMLAYGRFTEKVLDLSGGKEGLHMIYGPNEAGKSIALRALTNFFFGIPARTNDNFLHDNTNLRIGALILHSDGTRLHAVRRKGLKDTLLNEFGIPIPDKNLEKYLGEVSREMFSNMFAMDHEVLVEGGKALVEGGGDIGQSLFAAGMGVAGMRGMLASLEAEAGNLFKASGKNPKINRLIHEFKVLKSRCDEKSLSSKDWVLHDEKLRSALKEKEIIGRELLDLSSERHRMERLLRAVPKIASLMDLRAEMKKMGEIRQLPPGFSKKRQETQDMLHHAQSSEAKLRRDLEKIQGDLARISPEGSLIKAQDEIRDLFQRSGSHKKAMMDLPKRKADKHRMLDEAQAVLKKLGPDWTLENVESRRITDTLMARIRELGRELEPILERQTVAHKANISLESEMLAAKETLSNMPSPKDSSSLKAALSKVMKQGDLSESLKKIKGELRARREHVETHMKNIGLWKGSMAALESTTPPSEETIDQFESDFIENRSRLERVEQALGEQKDRLFGLERQLEALKGAGPIPTVEELEQARRNRDEGWRLIKESWLFSKEEVNRNQSVDADDAALAEGYEKRVKAADDIGDRLRNESERVAKQVSLSADRQEVEKRISALSEDLARMKTAYSGIESEWHKMWETIPIRLRRPREMRAWLQRYHKLMEEIARRRAVKEEAERLETLMEDDRKLLIERLKALGEAPNDKDEDLDDLLNQCDGVVKRVEEERNKRENLFQHIHDLERRNSVAVYELKQTEEALKSWQKMWGEAVDRLGLDVSALPGEADTVLGGMQSLFDLIDQAGTMQGRIQAMEKDAEEFSIWVSNLCTRLAPDLKKMAPEVAAAALSERLDRALADTARFQELEKQHISLKASIQSEHLIVDESEAKLSDMCREGGVGSYEELPEVEERSDLFRKRREKIEELEEELAGYSAGSGIEALIQEAKDVDADTLPAEIGALTQRIQALEEKRSELDQLIGSEKAVLDSMDGRAEAAELAEKAQGVLAELRDAVERYARVSVASKLLRKEIERYREANQGPILRRASEIFAALTLNSFEGLVPDFDDKDNPILMGVRPNNEKVSVAGMSDGTSDQLYLSLRLASLEQRLLGGEPMPLILDDILINFDDDRSCATLEALEVLSKKTQIIFFTHHHHILELAKTKVSKEVLIPHYLES